MPNPKHIERLVDDSDDWNEWREENSDIRPDLRGADLSEEDLTGANLRNADLAGADCAEADLTDADLSGADARMARFRSGTLYSTNFTRANLLGSDFSEANLDGAIFSHANLKKAKLNKASMIGADLCEANLPRAGLQHANLHGANLRGANLQGATLVRSNLTGAFLIDANLSGANLHGALLIDTNLQGALLCDCRVYGVSAWGMNLEAADQRNLVITPHGEQTITVDDLEIAQFVYLLLSNDKIRNVIQTIGRKAVLILGRFTPERKIVLDALRDELRLHDYVPMLFDFEGPSNRDISETVSTLAHMARFIIADITDARSIPQELMLIVPNLPSVPIQPLLLDSQLEYGMFEHFRRYPWVLEPFRYADARDLRVSMKERVIAPAETRLNQPR
jgi:uncharacterized protein YjbI with pentapeptide repeats